jgi:hypothetical protein
VRRVVTDQPRPVGTRACHHVQVIHVVARHCHGWSVPAIRHEHDVARPDLGNQVRRAVVTAIDPVVAEARAGRARAELEIVDLLQDALPRLLGVVLVRRVGRPVPGRRQYLAGDQPVGLEGSWSAEVVDLPRAGATATQLHRHLAGRAVASREPLARGRRRQCEPPAMVRADDGARIPGQVGEVGDGAEHSIPARQLEPLVIACHQAGPREGQDQHLLIAGRDHR